MSRWLIESRPHLQYVQGISDHFLVWCGDVHVIANGQSATAQVKLSKLSGLNRSSG